MRCEDGGTIDPRLSDLLRRHGPGGLEYRAAPMAAGAGRRGRVHQPTDPRAHRLRQDARCARRVAVESRRAARRTLAQAADLVPADARTGRAGRCGNTDGPDPAGWCGVGHRSPRLDGRRQWRGVALAATPRGRSDRHAGHAVVACPEPRLWGASRALADGIRPAQPRLLVGDGRSPAHGRGPGHVGAAAGLSRAGRDPRRRSAPVQHVVDERDAAAGLVAGESRHPRAAARPAVHAHRASAAQRAAVGRRQRAQTAAARAHCGRGERRAYRAACPHHRRSPHPQRPRRARADAGGRQPRRTCAARLRCPCLRDRQVPARDRFAPRAQPLPAGRPCPLA
jgi:hypothetical protein